MKKYSTILSLSLLSLFGSTAYAAHRHVVGLQGPWMTGPLLAPSGSAVPVNNFNVEFYTFYTPSFGSYSNSWQFARAPKTLSTNMTTLISYGLVKNIDIEAIVPYNFNSRSGQYASSYGDLSFDVGFQFMEGTVKDWKPSMRLMLAETIPSGRFNNLDPLLNGADSFGGGAYLTTMTLIIQKLRELSNGHFLSTRLALGYTLPSDVSVRNINAYGGAIGTNGVVSLGSRFTADLAFEYTLTQHWVPAVDIFYANGAASSFSGTAGLLPSGLAAPNSSPSSASISLAPALEYNFNSRVGIIAGTWFTVTGRNSGQFSAVVGALNVYY